jgi:two-component system CheB/CheR fusion protein
VEDSSTTDPVAIVGLGASAGGLQAYTEFLLGLPADTDMAFVVVQHLAAEHESLLATILARSTPMQVIQVDHEPRMQRNTVYVIPPNRSMRLEDGKLLLNERAPGAPRSVDIFFSALAETHGQRAIGVVFSGTGNDGVIGMEAIKAAGGTTFAQDSTAIHSGMPQSAVDSGCIDFILSPREIAAEIARLAATPDFFDGTNSAPLNISGVIDIIRQAIGMDFSKYKPNTLQRRIRRRMLLHKITVLEDYQDLLRSSPQEVQYLHQDILISVTTFFRNPESFAILKQSVLPRLFERESTDDPIRVWVIGCSTGEEPYSLAILLQEYMLEQQRLLPVVIFATDVNDSAIERARKAWYPKAIEADISEERLKRFFVEQDGGYCVTKAIRDLCVFATHNALVDPPFSRIDLVSCRNTLIYFQADLQRRLLPMIHYALKPGGVLFLGSSETVAYHRELFAVEDLHHKLYSKRSVARRLDMNFLPASTLSGASAPSTRRPMPMVADRGFDLQREVDRILLKQYAPPGVVVNDEAEVLQFRGDTDTYLTRPEGKANLNLLKMAREGLLAPLRALLQRVQDGSEIARESGIWIKTRDGLLEISLNAIALPAANGGPRMYCVLFETSSQSADSARLAAAARPPGEVASDDAERQIQLLTQELAATRNYLESTIELQQASNEELQSANEEVQSTNEELQSANEELETSKEEIQSSNEELTTVNQELRVRNDELDRANDDLNNVFSSVQMAVVMVWSDMRIRRYTPLAQKLFNLLPNDLGRSIGDMNLTLDIPDFSRQLTEVVEQGIVRETEVRSRDDKNYLLRIQPYRTESNQIDGAVIVLIDIDVLSRTQETLRKRVMELAEADRHKNEFLAILAHELRNPLAPLRNAVQILKMSPTDGEVSSRARELIERQVKHMSRMVNDLLDAARAEHGQIKLQRERLDLRAVTERGLEGLLPQFEAKHQNVKVSLPAKPVMIDADPVRVDQIVTNLLSNANKYSADRGTIDIRIGLASRSSADRGMVVLSVRDDGQGIDAELLPRLFNLFTQADRSLAHSQGGLGIGLSLVRTLTELHGGTVSAHSSGRNLGSEFVVRLPAYDEQHRVTGDDIEEDEDGADNGAKHRILVVDDDRDISESSEIILSFAGHDVRIAASGKEALDVAKEFEPNVVLLDIGLPDMSGYEVARQLRRMPELRGARLIAVSGYDTPEARAKSEEAGFDYHVGKPVNLAALGTLFE